MINRTMTRMSLGAAAAALLVFCLKVYGHADNVPKDIQTKKNPVAASDDVLAKAKGNYEENCLQCHGEKGKGDGPMASMLKDKPTDISDTEMMSAMTDGEIFWAITKGKKPLMAPFETKLPEPERWGLIHLLRSMSKTKSNNTPHK